MNFKFLPDLFPITNDNTVINILMFILQYFKGQIIRSGILEFNDRVILNLDNKKLCFPKVYCNIQ